jgi:regulator of protease activity HflC (stomatin/prohibitin superfamily)
MVLRRIPIAKHQRGLLFRENDFRGILEPGTSWVFDPLYRVRVEKLDATDVEFSHDRLREIVNSGALDGIATIADVKDRQIGIVRVNGRIKNVIGPSLYAYLTVISKVEVELIDIKQPEFKHPDLRAIMNAPGARHYLYELNVAEGHKGALFVDRKFDRILDPGQYVFFSRGYTATLQLLDVRHRALDIQGQEIMTKDRVSLRVNAVVTGRLVDPVLVATQVQDPESLLCKSAQLVLRELISALDLEDLLADKNSVGADFKAALVDRSKELGFEIQSAGIKDVILPGEIRHYMNKVTEARKAAEAAIITRREETASVRSQANTAKVLEGNPTLLRLRELDSLEKILSGANLTIVSGKSKLVDKLDELT